MALHLAILILLVSLTSVLSEFHHQSPEQYKLSLGWQEPGLWRPKWVMDRIFTDPVTEKVISTDRLYFKLLNDRTMKIFKKEKRPWLEIGKMKKNQEKEEKKKKLFETGEEKVDTPEESFQKSKLGIDFFDNDGTWWWQDAAPLDGGKVKMETREDIEVADKINGGVKTVKKKIMHDVNCVWGTLDGYAAKFRKGKILKYKMTEAGIPTGTVPAGSFRIRVCTHRPLVAKDFMAIQ